MGSISLILKGFYPPSKLSSSKLTFTKHGQDVVSGNGGNQRLLRAGHCTGVLWTGWEYGQLSKDLRQALKPLSLPCITGVNCTPGSVAGISPLRSPTEAQKMVMPVKPCLQRHRVPLGCVHGSTAPWERNGLFLHKCPCLRQQPSAIH